MFVSDRQYRRFRATLQSSCSFNSPHCKAYKIFISPPNWAVTTYLFMNVTSISNWFMCKTLLVGVEVPMTWVRVGSWSKPQPYLLFPFIMHAKQLQAWYHPFLRRGDRISYDAGKAGNQPPVCNTADYHIWTFFAQAHLTASKNINRPEKRSVSMEHFPALNINDIYAIFIAARVSVRGKV